MFNFDIDFFLISSTVNISERTWQGWELGLNKFIIDWVKKNKRKIYVYNDPKKAVKNADVIFSDKVVSLNDRVNKKKKIRDFRNYRVNSSLLKYAKKDVIFLHCLPRDNEVSDDVFLGNKSKVWQQALNRVHVQKSILLYCFGKLR